ncbi:MAG: hypothetical protein HY958_10480 [Bacteroidia bacterium]|nr:hypothetical protein [Bacteroidia bacterium]
MISKNKFAILILASIIFCNADIFSQNVGINTDGSDPDAKALLDIKASGYGLLIPRMTWANIPTGLTATQDGLTIYSTDGDGTNGKGYYYWDGAAWKKMFAGANNDYILNQTGQQASSNFNISGAGVIGTTLTVSGNIIYGQSTGDVLMTLSSRGGIRMQPDNNNSGSEDFAIKNGGGSNVFTVTAGGNVSANGNADFNGNLTLSGNSADRTIMGPGGNYGLKMLSNGSLTFDIDNNADQASLTTSFTKQNGTNLFVIPQDNTPTVYPYGTAAGNAGGIRFRELAANGTDMVGFKAPDALGGDYIFTLPSGFGSNLQVLQSDGAGGLSWANLSDANAWKISGNSGTTAGTNFIGTTDDQDMVFKTGATTLERMRIKATVNEIVFGRLDGSGTTVNTILRGADITGTDKTGADITIQSGNGTGTGGSGDLVFKTAPVAASSATANTMTERMRIVKDGNVGIGISSPNHLLHLKTINSVTDGTDGNLVDIENYLASNGAISGLRFKVHSVSSTGYFKAGIFYQRTGANGIGDIIFANNSVASSANVTTTDTRMIIKNSGNVGIGTTTPANILDVEGGVAIGAAYSGTNTAPSNGLIIEGNTCIGSTTVNWPFEVKKTVTASGGFAKGVNLEQTLTAGANNDKLHALHIKPTFTNGAYTGVDNYGLVVEGAYVKSSNQIYIIPLWQAGSNFNMTNTSGADLSNCETGIDPDLFDPRGELQVKLVIRVTSAAGTNNFQLRCAKSGTSTYPIISTDGWTWASTETGYVVISDWKDWSAGTSNGWEMHLYGWTSSGGNCNFNSAYIMVRPKP